MMEQMAAPQPDIERFRRRELDGRAPDEVFHRQVEISESALADASEDNTFINPSFLLSQQPTQRPAGSAPVQRSQSAGNVRKDSEGDMMSIFQRGKPASSSSSSLSAEGSQSADNSAAGSSSLLSAFARAKEKTSAPSAAPAVDRTSGNANGMAPLTISYHTPAAPPTSSSSQKSTAGVAFGLAAAQKAPSFHVPEKVVRTMDSTIADYFAAPAPSQPSSSQAGSASQRPLSQLSQSQAAKRPVLNIPKMESTADKIAAASSQTQGGKPQSFLSYLSQLDDEIHYAQVDPVTDFHNNIGMPHVTWQFRCVLDHRSLTCCLLRSLSSNIEGEVKQRQAPRAEIQADVREEQLRSVHRGPAAVRGRRGGAAAGGGRAHPVQRAY
jgi:hypothetical protein